MAFRTLLLALLALALIPGRAGAAVVCSPQDDGDAPFVLGDVDNDDAADIAIGLPETGVVVVRQTKRHTVTLTGPDSFGTGVAIGDINADGCADVLVGAPEAGTVFLYRGSPTGLSTKGEPLMDPSGEDFGTAVVIGDDRDTDGTDVWIGAPGRDNDDGAVDHYVYDAAGTPTLAGTVTAASPSAERYGSVLAPSSNGVWVGVPRRDGMRGAVERLTRAGTRRVTVLPHARANDRFGASLSTQATDVAGAPGRRHRRGAVYDLDHHREYTQDSPGVSGAAKAGNRFGYSVVGGRALTCQEDFASFAAGAPGDDSVTVLSREKGCSKRFVNAGAGAALGLRRFRDDFDEDTYDTLLEGVPGHVFARQDMATTSKLQIPAGKQVFAVVQSGSAF